MVEQLRSYLNVSSTEFAVVVALGGFAIFLLLSRVKNSLINRHRPLSEALAVTRNFLLPAGILLLVSILLLPEEGSISHRLLKTVFGISLIYVALSLVKGFFFAKDSNGNWRSRVPNLFLDLTQFAMVGCGAALVIAWVWNRDLGGFLATLGIGSIVLGLALQDTLGNVFAGIALLFERPFSVGDWIKVGDSIGVVIEINWRSVRIRTRSLDMVVVPNLVLGKELITNFTRPTDEHGEEFVIGFSFNDPPNKVKRVLAQCALATPGILPRGISIRTLNYGDSAITYQARLFLSDYERLNEIREDYMTRVWYAARREGLTFPYPMRTVYKTEVPYRQQASEDEKISKALAENPLFASLNEKEIEHLAHEAAFHNFARSERIIRQGDKETSLYLLLSGSVSVSRLDAANRRHELATLEAGDFFGEMSLLTGEERSANVDALEDCDVIVIFKESLQTVLEQRATLAEGIAQVMHDRFEALRSAKSNETQGYSGRDVSAVDREGLLKAIRGFFGLR